LTYEPQGKLALVTGASGGVGSAIALAAEGATLALAYGSRPELAHRRAAGITNGGGRATAIGADLRSATAPEELVDTVEGTLRR
jgi:3-oxoacyl-[acyl-carrier protein] reductase